MNQTTNINHDKVFSAVADLLRGAYKRSEFWRVILPFTVLRRLDCVLQSSDVQVSEKAPQYSGDMDKGSPTPNSPVAQTLYNSSGESLASLVTDPDNLPNNLRAYIAGFPPYARDVIGKFNFDSQITRLATHNLLYLVVSQGRRP